MTPVAYLHTSTQDGWCHRCERLFTVGDLVAKMTDKTELCLNCSRLEPMIEEEETT